MGDAVAKVWHELWLALVLAAVFAIIADLIRIGSRIREIIRSLKNFLAGRSRIRIAKRIRQLERERQKLATYLDSDKTLYLHLLRYTLSSLFLLCIGCVMFGAKTLLESWRVFEPFASFSAKEFSVWFLVLAELGMGVFFAAAFVAFEGIRVSTWENRHRIEKVIAKLDGEIVDMRRKLDM
jgi:hypothetical protein